MAEYSRLAKGSFTSTGAAQVINLPFQPDTVSMWNYTAADTNATSQNIITAQWDVIMGQGQAIIQGYNGTALIYDVVSSGGISSFSGGIAQQYGPAQAVASFSNASQCVVTTSSPHGYTVGTTVIMTGLGLATPTKNTQLMNGVPFTIVAVGSTTEFTINWNTATGANYPTSTGSVKQVLYPFLYLPQDNVISALTLSTTTTVSTTMYHNLEIGQEVAFRIPPQWGTTQLNSLPNVLIPGQPIYGYVVSLTDNWNFVVNINSTGYTAYTDNFTVTASSVVGINYPQVVPVGDVNTGGKAISAGSPLYPPPAFPLPNNSVGTINGPAIKGAFVNNTSQGFIIGAGAGRVLTTGVLVGASSNVIYWEAKLHDLVMP